jgi:hypothetical protein
MRINPERNTNTEQAKKKKKEGKVRLLRYPKLG